METNLSTRLNPGFRRCGILLVLVVSVVFLSLAWHANTDLANGRYALFMDEQISYDQIRRILHPENFAAWLDQVRDGGDHRYGRIFYNLTALFSFLPDRIFGPAGMIVADRMTQVVFLWIAYFLLTRTFLENWLARGITLFLLCCLPFTSYYATMPKPEPVQLLMLAFFFRMHVRRGFAFGNHWILLGAAFGAKISAVTLVPLLVCDSFLRYGRKNLLSSVVSFLLGLGLAVPILFRGGWHRWIDSTFKNTGHAQDDLAVNAFSWLNHIGAAYFGSSLLAAVFCGLTIAFVVLLLREACSKWDERYRSTVLVFGAGLFLTLPILLRVKRVWGFYLHNGMVFIVLGLAMAVSISLENPRRLIRGLGIAVATLLVLIAGLRWAPSTLGSFSSSATRTSTVGFRESNATYLQVKRELSDLRGRIGRPIRVLLDPTLFQPDSTAEIGIFPFWGAFHQYDAGVDAIIAYRKQFGDPAIASDYSPSQPAGRDYAVAWQEFQSHSRLDHRPACLKKPCYLRRELSPDLILLTWDGPPFLRN